MTFRPHGGDSQECMGKGPYVGINVGDKVIDPGGEVCTAISGLAVQPGADNFMSVRHSKARGGEHSLLPTEHVADVAREERCRPMTPARARLERVMAMNMLPLVIVERKPTPRTTEWLARNFRNLLEETKTDLQEFSGKRRCPSLVAQRRQVWYGLRHLKGPGGVTASYPEIAWTTGRFNHSTVLTALKKITDADRTFMAPILERLRDAADQMPILVAAATGRV